jgi:hypothetical protein
MSSGFYTRHYLEDGRSFYFNAERNVSSWTAPADCTAHEAVGAKSNIIPSPGSAATLDATIEKAQDEVVEVESIQETSVVSEEPLSMKMAHDTTISESIDDLLNAGREQAVAKSNRFKNHPVDKALVTTETSEYERLVSSYKQASGTTSDQQQGGKWLVR